MKRTKLRDIAEALDISIATVSRALNNKLDINENTKSAVLDMAQRLNYKPNNLAVSLRKNDSLRVVGVIVPLVSHAFFASILEGILKKAKEFNYFVLIGESQHSSVQEKTILDEFSDFGVSGILMAPAKHSDFSQNVLSIIHTRTPVVVIDRMYDNYNGNYVNNNDYAGAYKATAHLIEQGYKRIAHIGSSDSWSIGHERREGYLAALKDHNILFDENYLVNCDFNNKEEGTEEGYRAAHRLFSLKNPPDAIFSVTDDVATGIYMYAKEHQISIPGQLGVVGFSNSDLSSLLDPPLTTLAQNPEYMGSVSFDYFYKALHSNGQVYQTTLEPELLIRKSSLK